MLCLCLGIRRPTLRTQHLDGMRCRLENKTKQKTVIKLSVTDNLAGTGKAVLDLCIIGTDILNIHEEIIFFSSHICF